MTMSPDEDLSAGSAEAQDRWLGKLLDGRYLLLEELGSGGMSTVYKARHETIGRIVAVKLMHEGLSEDPAMLKRFQREAKAVSRLSHPNLIMVHDFGTTEDGLPYQVTEFIDGRSLGDLIDAGGALAPERTADLLVQVCDAMEHAHSNGIIHRDLKPGNIMIVDSLDHRSELVKVVDFGIVKLTSQSQMLSQRLTQTGEVWGSPSYASPEQCLGQELDVRSDVYSLGIVMYEMLTGKKAITGKNIGQIAVKQVKDMPAPFGQACPELSIPEELERITFKAVQKEPARRFQSMAEMRSALESYRAGQGAGRAAPAAPAPARSRQEELAPAVQALESLRKQQAPPARPACDRTLRGAAGEAAASRPGVSQWVFVALWVVGLVALALGAWWLFVTISSRQAGPDPAAQEPAPPPHEPAPPPTRAGVPGAQAGGRGAFKGAPKETARPPVLSRSSTRTRTTGAKTRPRVTRRSAVPDADPTTPRSSAVEEEPPVKNVPLTGDEQWLNFRERERSHQ